MNKLNNTGDRPVEHKIHVSPKQPTGSEQENVKKTEVAQQSLISQSSEQSTLPAIQEKHTVTRFEITHTPEMEKKYKAMEENYKKETEDTIDKRQPEHLKFLVDYGKSIREYEDAVWDSGFFNWVNYVGTTAFSNSDERLNSVSKITKDYNLRLSKLEDEDERESVHSMTYDSVMKKKYKDYKYEGTYDLLPSDEKGIGNVSGYGVQTFTNGDSYTGQFELGKKSGRGRYYNFASGNSFEGKFKDGLISDGVKTYTNPSNHEQTFTGEFEKGKPKDGTLIYTDGRIFAGKFNKEGEPDVGKVTDPKNYAQGYFVGKVDKAGKPLVGRMYSEDGTIIKKIEPLSDKNIEMKNL